MQRSRSGGRHSRRVTLWWRGASRGGARLQFRHGRPAISGRFDVDNVRRGRDGVGHPRHGRFEVHRVHVRLAGCAVPKGFEQHKLVGPVGASRPCKEEVARLGPCGGREGGDTREPLVCDFWTDGELHSDEDHQCSWHITHCCVCGASLPEAARVGLVCARRGLRTVRIAGDGSWRIIRA